MNDLSVLKSKKLIKEMFLFEKKGEKRAAGHHLLLSVTVLSRYLNFAATRPIISTQSPTIWATHLELVNKFPWPLSKTYE